MGNDMADVKPVSEYACMTLQMPLWTLLQQSEAGSEGRHPLGGNVELVSIRKAGCGKGGNQSNGLCGAHVSHSLQQLLDEVALCTLTHGMHDHEHHWHSGLPPEPLLLHELKDIRFPAWLAATCTVGQQSSDEMAMAATICCVQTICVSSCTHGKFDEVTGLSARRHEQAGASPTH